MITQDTSHTRANQQRPIGAQSRPVLEIRGLSTSFFIPQGVVKAVDGVSFHVEEGEIVALVGESGCGKTVTCLSTMRLIQRPGKILGGEVHYAGMDVLDLPDKDSARLRGKELAMIFQEPGAAFDPVFTIGYQIMETIRQHTGATRHEASERAISLLEMVGIDDPARRMSSYPFELSGGMLQRAMIAIAISCNPRVIFADEPTTSLDATTQLQILELLHTMVRETGTALILVTHNLGLVARYADRLYVMYAGRVVESGTTEQVYLRPLHPYTEALWACVPRLDQSDGGEALEGTPPRLVDMPPGCAFEQRCKYATTICHGKKPALSTVENGHVVACHLSNDNRTSHQAK